MVVGRVLVVLAACMSWSTLIAQESTDGFYRGRAVVKASPSAITIPFDIQGVVFDTTLGRNDQRDHPDWSFIGSLRIDSLVMRIGDSTVPLLDREQIEGLMLDSSLADAFAAIRIRKLRKSHPDKTPEDTLYWDSVRVKQHVLQDMSVYYRIRFSEEFSVDSLLEILNSLNVLDGTSRIPIPRWDGSLNDVVEPWLPNDSAFADSVSPNWALGEKNPDRTGGISAAHAWGLLEDTQRGNVTIAVLDGYGVATEHPDLIDKFSLLGENHHDSSAGWAAHGTGVAGIALAATNNEIGVAGVAPDAILIPYHVNWPLDEEDFDDWDHALDSSLADVIVFPAHFCPDYIDSIWAEEFQAVLYRAYAMLVPVIVSVGNNNCLDMSTAKRHLHIKKTKN